MSEISDDLTELNARMAEYDIVIFKNAGGRYRLYGDINRMQEVVDNLS